MGERGIRIREETERGDIAKSLQALVQKHFVSKRFRDIMGATRLRKSEVLILSMMEIQRRQSQIISLSKSDVDAVIKDPESSDDEKEEIKMLWQLKKRFFRNPHALSFATYDSFEYMFGLGMQSHDGLSRHEGVTLVGGAYRRILDPDDMGRMDRIKRRLFGNVLFPE